MPSEDKCWLVDDGKFGSIRDWMIWLGESEWAWSWDLLPSFWRWRLISISSAIALIPNVGNILKAPRIHKVALLCIFPNIFKKYDNGAWL